MRIHLRAMPACLLAVSVLLGAAGCGKQPVAIVNGAKITRQEFTERLEQAAGEQVLQDLIVRRLLEDAFAQSGLALAPEEVAAEVEKLKKQAPSEEEWQRFLTQQGLDEAKLAQEVGFRMKLMKLSQKGLNPTEQDLKKEFERYREDFDRPATVVLSEIVVSSKAEADKVRAELKSPKANFQALARQYSISAMTRERGGRRGEEPIEQVMPDALRPVVARLAPGEVSSPIKVDENWYIIRVEEKKAAQKADYAKVKDMVRQHYMDTHGKSPQDILAELRKTAKVSILDPRYQRLGEAFNPPQQLPTFGSGEKKAEGKAPAEQPATKAPAAPATGQ